MNKYIGVDLGTSSSKFLLVDIEGNVDKQYSVLIQSFIRKMDGVNKIHLYGLKL